MSRLSRGFRGFVYRIHAADKNALDTEASKISGGRWNKANRFGALYASLTKETAQAEYTSQLLKRGLTPEDLTHRLVTTIQVQLEKVLDLTDPDWQKEFGITKPELESDEQTCRKKILEVCEKARAQNFEAILSPSARYPRGKNLNIFADRLSPKSSLRVIKSESLETRARR